MTTPDWRAEHEGLSPQHTVEDGVLFHTRMKSKFSMPRSSESWTSTPCTCTPAERTKAYLGLAHRDILVAALEAVLERHKPETRWVNPEYGGSFDSEEEASNGWEDGSDASPTVTTFIVCSGCAEINKSAMEDAGDWDFLPEVYFPCAEYKKIAGILGVNIDG